jgi:hypothetical protein
VFEQGERLCCRPVFLLGEHIGVMAALVYSLLVLGAGHLDERTAEVLDQERDAVVVGLDVVVCARRLDLLVPFWRTPVAC